MIAARLDELVAALMLLTRLPVWRLGRDLPRHPADAVWAYPLVGLLVGAMGAAVLVTARHLGLSAWSAALLALGAQMLITGALHEDGLADMADGFGGGRDRDAKLAIMRDSRVGSFGVLALILAVGVRVSALAELVATGDAVMAMLVAGLLSRAAMLGLLASMRPARADGLAAALDRPNLLATGAGLAIGLGFAAALLPGLQAILAVIAALVAACAVRTLALGQIGGQTGDVLGGCAVIAETLVLLSFS